MKLNILLFWHTNDWGLYGRAYEQFAQALAKHKNIRRVVVILPPVKSDDGGFFFSTQHVTPKLTVITPYWRSINGSGRFYNLRTFINKRLPVIKVLKIYLSRYGFNKNNTVLWVYPPHDYIYLLESIIPHRLLVTQIVDNNSTRDVTHTAAGEVNKAYRHFSSLADIIFTSSQYNFDIFNKPDNRCFLIENGVSDAFFCSPSLLPYKVNKARPRLGYIGFITERTDVDLMCYIARHCPEYDLIIAGPDEGKLSNSDLLSYSNVLYLGAVSQDRVIELISSFDVCIIPHIDNPYSQSMSPLKLYQYLASGRPIVSTPVAGTERFAKSISLADSAPAFVKAIQESLRTESISSAEKRIMSIKQERWDNRVEEMVSALYEL